MPLKVSMATTAALNPAVVKAPVHMAHGSSDVTTVRSRAGGNASLSRFSKYQ